MYWKLKLMFLQAGRPQWEIAQELGISESQLSRVLRGRVAISPSDLDKLAALLAVSREELDAAMGGGDHG